MTNTTAKGDLLGFARESTSRRLRSLARSSDKFSPEQLTLLKSLLDEFSRKSRAEARRNNAAHLTNSPQEARNV